VEQTPDGGFVLIGTVWLAGALSSDILLLRTDPQGEELWRRRYGGTDVDWGTGLEQTTDGGVVLVGTSWSGISKRAEVYLAKVDSSGNPMWSHRLGGRSRELGHGVRQLADGGFAVAGTTDSFGSGAEDGWLIRTDLTGKVLWQKTYGGERADRVYSLCAGAGGLVAVGETASFAEGGTDVYVIQTDASGKLLWEKALGGAGKDQARSIRETRGGGFLITGSTWRQGQTRSDLYLLRLNADGSLRWERALGGEYADHGHFAIQAADGGFIAVGNTWPFGTLGRSEIYLVRTHEDGRTDWVRRFGGSGDGYGYWVRQTADGGFIVVGRSNSLGGRDRIFLLKTDARGNRMWYKTYG
jgi:hypothetical protein